MMAQNLEIEKKFVETAAKWNSFDELEKREAAKFLLFPEGENSLFPPEGMSHMRRVGLFIEHALSGNPPDSKTAEICTEHDEKGIFAWVALRRFAPAHGRFDPETKRFLEDVVAARGTSGMIVDKTLFGKFFVSDVELMERCGRGASELAARLPQRIDDIPGTETETLDKIFSAFFAVMEEVRERNKAAAERILDGIVSRPEFAAALLEHEIRAATAPPRRGATSEILTFLHEKIAEKTFDGEPGFDEIPTSLFRYEFLEFAADKMLRVLEEDSPDVRTMESYMRTVLFDEMAKSGSKKASLAAGKIVALVAAENARTETSGGGDWGPCL